MLVHAPCHPNPNPSWPWDSIDLALCSLARAILVPVIGIRRGPSSLVALTVAGPSPLWPLAWAPFPGPCWPGVCLNPSPLAFVSPFAGSYPLFPQRSVHGNSRKLSTKGAGGFPNFIHLAVWAVLFLYKY